ncbi:MAG TPA: hypothetical protein VMT17_11190 [Anaeromyxobacteraceae bacterium]|nr:hypothetical protein [Anaeromyxobacteraceae bacterium]
MQVRDDVRDFIVVGHRVRVVRCAPDSWAVAVDGHRCTPECRDPHSAWALGVAESYRLGPRRHSAVRSRGDHDASEMPDGSLRSQKHAP